MLSSNRTWGRAALAATALALLAAVSVSETSDPTAIPGGSAVLHFHGGDAESDAVTISLAGETADRYTIEVVDSGARLEPGESCSSGGAAGAKATCSLRKPVFPETKICGRDCGTIVPGTGWRSQMTVDLGEGDNTLDASRVPDQMEVAVSGGAGGDKVTTGDGADTIDPGAGSDEVHSGAGEDRLLATATPDGPDVYDLGEGFDLLSYARRTAPAIVSGSSGGAGEGDTLNGVDFLVGGSGDDHLAVGDTFGAIDGRDGNDVLVGGNAGDIIFGGNGNDSLYGNGGNDALDGEEGDDLLEGGAGDDHVFEEPHRTEGDLTSTLGTAPGITGGNDVADGGEGDDRLDLGSGEDRAEGGEGDDEAYGEAGDDAVAGGPGDDKVAGEAGTDRLWGGPGSDLLLAGRIEEHRYSIRPRSVDTWSDVVNCGAGDDAASINRWDRSRQCEQTTLVPLLRIRKLRRDLRSGSARLRLHIAGGGRLVLRGHGISTVVRTTPEPTPGVDGGRRVTFAVRARGGALRRLRRRGHVTVPVTIRFRPYGGLVRVRRTQVLLVRR